MHCVSQALKRVRNSLLGEPAPRDVACAAQARSVGPHPIGFSRSPEMWGALLVEARRRRAPQLWPSPERPLDEDDFITHALVRAYVLPEDEQTRRLASPMREAW